MVAITTILGIIFSISFLVFVLFFGRLPALRKTPIGSLNRLLSVRIPNGLQSMDQSLTGGNLSSYGASFFRYMMHERHPTVLILFILLLSVSEYLYLPWVFPTKDPLTQLLMLPVIALPYIFLYLSVTTSPGEITPANLPTELTRYPYDQVLYHSSPVPICSTCNMIKPARSKHCSLCKMCVARADHHCIFINACVGAGNQAYFLLLLVTTALLCICGAALGLPYLADVVRQKYTSFTLWGTGYSWSEYGMFWLWILNKRPAAAGVTILCVMCTPLVAGLGAYSFYLVWAGVTTNESGKWDNVKMDIVEGILWKRVLDARHVEGRMEGVGRLESRWPVRPKVVAVCCDDTPDERFDIGEGAWEKVTDIQELENVYDVGFCDNLRDVFLSRRNLEESWAAGR